MLDGDDCRASESKCALSTCKSLRSMMVAVAEQDERAQDDVLAKRIAPVLYRANMRSRSQSPQEGSAFTEQGKCRAAPLLCDAIVRRCGGRWRLRRTRKKSRVFARAAKMNQ